MDRMTPHAGDPNSSIFRELKLRFIVMRFLKNAMREMARVKSVLMPPPARYGRRTVCARSPSASGRSANRGHTA
jgi:hypothetical protein